MGAGTGSYVRVNPVSNRIEIGPDFAGSRVGLCNPRGGVETVTLSDCNVLLGYLNPNNFLGGDVILDPERSLAGIKKQIADPLGLDPYEAAEGVLSLFEDHLRNEVYARIFGKGYAPEDYQLYSYGGGGPLHVAGYTKGLRFAEVIVPAWAAGFSAFGCACADFEYRMDRTVNVAVQSPDLNPTGFAAGFANYAAAVNAAWEALEQRVIEEFAKSGVGRERVEFGRYVRVQYVGQLNDVEVKVPFERISTEGNVREIISGFEEAYAKLYSRAATSPELGYLTTTAVLKGVVPVEKPRLPTDPLGPSEPTADSLKGTRKVYREGKWHDAKIYHMERLQPGNRFGCISIIKSPSTTLVIPTGFEAYLDEHRLFHLYEI